MEDSTPTKSFCAGACAAGYQALILAGSLIDRRRGLPSKSQRTSMRSSKDQALDTGLKNVTESLSSLITKRAPKGKFFNNIQPISVGV